MVAKIIEFIKFKQSEIVLAIAIVFISIIAFQSGKISALKNLSKPLVIKDPSQSAQIDRAGGSINHMQGLTLQNAGKTNLQVVASKNSTVYHFPWCPGAQKIKEENKITFASEQEAQSRGYTLASNCKK